MAQSFGAQLPFFGMNPLKEFYGRSTSRAVAKKTGLPASKKIWRQRRMDLSLFPAVLSAFYIFSCSMWSRRTRLSEGLHILVGQMTTGSLIAPCLAAGTTKALGIFVRRIKFILCVAVSALDCRLKPISPVAQSRSPFLGKEGDQLIH